MSDPTANMQPSPSQPRFVRWAAGIFVLALLIRLIHVFQINSEPLLGVLINESFLYHQWAEEIASGNWWGQEVFSQSPLYPYFLGIIYMIFDESLIGVRVCQSLLGAMSCVLLADTGRRLFSKSVGILTGLGLACYAPSIFFDGLIEKSVLDLFFLSLMLWLIGRLMIEPAGKASWIVLGVTLGALILTHESALIFIPALLLWPVVQFRTLGRQRLAMPVALIIGLVVVLFPVAMRNQVVGDEFHLTNALMSTNFFISNNEDANGMHQPLRPGRGTSKYIQADAKILAEQEVGRELSRSEVSRYWTKRGLGYAASNSGAWLGLVASKFAMLWHASEMVDAVSLESYQRHSWPLWLAGFVCHFGILAPLALLGIMLTFEKRATLWLLYLMITLYTLGTVMFFVSAQDRYPLAAFLFLFAAAGVIELPRRWRSLSAVRIAWGAAATLFVAAISNQPGLVPGFSNVSHHILGVKESNFGKTLLLRGDLEGAKTHFETAVQAVPESIEYLNRLGQLLQLRGNAAEAQTQFEKSLRLDPDSAMSHSLLGVLHFSEGRRDEAVAELRRAIHLDPTHEMIHVNLANTLAGLGELDEAIDHYREGIRLRENYAEAYNNLGSALGKRGEMSLAEQAFRQALDYFPDYPEAHLNLGLAFHATGRMDEAQIHLLRTVALRPDNFRAHNTLGVIYGAQGRHEEAGRHLEKSLQLRPDFAEAHFNYAIALNNSSRQQDALLHVREAARLNPSHLPARNYLAGMLATHPDPEIRNPEQAIRVAADLVEETGRQIPMFLDTLAAAHASAGDFTLAMEIAGEAVDIAITAGENELAEDIRTRLHLYREGRPFVSERK